MKRRDRLDRLSLNQATVKHLSLGRPSALCGRHDIGAIGLWRDRVAEAGLAQAAAAVRAAGLRVLQPVPGRLLHGCGTQRPGER